MNTKIFMLAALAFSGWNVQAACLGEAQIIAKVDSIRLHNRDHCVVEVKEASISFYQESMNCPLDKQDVVLEGIRVGIKNGHDCELEIGDSVSSLLVRTSQGIVYVNSSIPAPTDELECARLGKTWDQVCTGNGNYGEVFEGCRVPATSACPTGWTYRVLEYGNGGGALCGRTPLKLIRSEPAGC